MRQRCNPRFVGLRNYARLFADDGFWNSLLVTAIFVFGSAIIGQFVLGLFSAIALNRRIVLRPLFLSAILLPNAVPEVVAGFMWISMLAGGEHSTLSRVVGLFGVAPQQWLQTAPLLMIIIVNTWRGIAFAMILMMSGLSAVPAEVYEAARMDGATPRQIFWRITLPLLRPTIFLYMLGLDRRHHCHLRPGLCADPGRPGRRDRDHRHLHLQPVLHRLSARLRLRRRGRHARHLDDPRRDLRPHPQSEGLADGHPVHARRGDRLRLPHRPRDLLPAAVLLGVSASVDPNATQFLQHAGRAHRDHFINIFTKETGGRWFFNSLVVVGLATALVVVVAGLGGYALSRSNAWWKLPFLYAIILVRVLPPTALIVPLYKVMLTANDCDRLGRAAHRPRQMRCGRSCISWASSTAISG